MWFARKTDEPATSMEVKLLSDLSKGHELIHQSVEMRLFALNIMALALSIYSTLNLVATTVLHG